MHDECLNMYFICCLNDLNVRCMLIGLVDRISVDPYIYGNVWINTNLFDSVEEIYMGMGPRRLILH